MRFGGMLARLEKKQVLTAAIAVAYAAGIFYLSDQPQLPEPGWPYQDVLFHFTEYLGFGFVLLMAARSRGVNNSVQAAIIIAVLYAVTDEAHQYFVPERFSSIKDIAVDAMGSLAGVKFYGLIRRAAP